MDRVPTLINDRTKVVRAKADRPKGAGLAKLLFGALMGVSRKRAHSRDCIVPVETRLKFTTKGSETVVRVVGSNVSQWVPAIVIRLPLLGYGNMSLWSVVSMVNGAGAIAIGNVDLLTSNACLMSRIQHTVLNVWHGEAYGIIVFLGCCHSDKSDLCSMDGRGLK